MTSAKEDTGHRLPDGRFAPALSNNPAGRPKGSPNQITKTIRESFTYVLEEIGGEMWLRQFVDDHPVEFFRALSKMLPRQFNIATQRVGYFSDKNIEDIQTRAEAINRQEKAQKLEVLSEIETSTDLEKVKQKAREVLGFFPKP